MQPGAKPKGDTSPHALYYHCLTTYEEMLRRSRKREGDGGEEMIVYEGRLTQLITGDLHLSVPYYTSITHKLKAMGCVRQLKRGGGTAASMWELITQPTLERFDAATGPKRPRQDKAALQQGQINAMNRRLSQLEATVDKLVAIVDELYADMHKDTKPPELGMVSDNG